MNSSVNHIHGDTLPSALEHGREIGKRLSGKRVVVFLDYDGTLTPIVDRPELAIMSEEMRSVVHELADLCTTAVISGRSRTKVYDLVNLDRIFYAGSHGFDIQGPHGSRIQYRQGQRFLPTIGSAFKELCSRLKRIEGALVEHTGFSITVHYRLVAEGDVPVIERIVDEVISIHPTLRKTRGKKVFEVRPNVDWDKGKAVEWILCALGLDKDDVVPVYLGDDVTDEDAFRAIREGGIGILVADSPRSSAAHYRLRDPVEVKTFLEWLTSLLKKKKGN